MKNELGTGGGDDGKRDGVINYAKGRRSGQQVLGKTIHTFLSVLLVSKGFMPQVVLYICLHGAHFIKCKLECQFLLENCTFMLF